jgi:hypothetical protein
MAMTQPQTPTPKVIQEHFGDTIIGAVHSFADRDLKTVPELERDLFAHVTEANLRRTLAETLYGARWIYKLGLALLVKDEKQLAHVRVQVIDYGSVCEGLLSNMIHHALSRGVMKGTKYQFNDTTNLRTPINWHVSDTALQLEKRSFHWMIVVAEEEGIIDRDLAHRLQNLRKERNTVHARTRTHKAFLGTSRHLFQVLMDTVSPSQACKRHLK